MLARFDAQRNFQQRRPLAANHRNILQFQERRHALV